MSERTKKFSAELDRLLKEGEWLYMAIQSECYKHEYAQQLDETYHKNEDAIKRHRESTPDFKAKYQSWYTEAQAVVKQVLPDRVADFISYFEYPRPRKEVTFQNYMIRDYLQGLTITRGPDKAIVVDGKAAIPEFVQQLSILEAAKRSLTSSLMDLKSILQADLFDTELDSARSLAKSGYLRAAGAISGVIIEKHLSYVCDIHSIAVKKKNPGISDLNQTLRDADVITIPQWRFTQHLADIRNLCDHAKGREPTKEEIADLVDGTDKVLKTIF